MLAICNTDVHVVSKALKTSLHSEKKTEASKSKTGQSNKETQSSPAKDKSPSHPSGSTHVVPEMHKEELQEAGGSTSLGATSEDRAHPQLSSGCDASTDSIAEADPGKYASNNSLPPQQGMDKGTKYYAPGHIFAGTNPSVFVDQTTSVGDGLKTAHTNLGTNEESRSDELSKKIKLEDLSDLIKDTRSAFFTPDSPQDEPIIVSDKSEEVETKKDEDTHDVLEDTSVPHPPSPKSTQIQELMAQPSYPDINHLTELLVTSLKPELSKLLASHDFASSIPSELKELPSKITTLAGEIQELKRHVQVAELKTLKWELPAEFLALPSQFRRIMENASHTATGKGVPSAGPGTASRAEGEKNPNPATKNSETINLHNELVDLLKSSKIINCDVLTQKVPITLQVYREDGTIEVISNVKVSDLHLAEWKEVVQACPDRKEKGWKTIYGLIKTRIEYLNQTEKELKTDFNKPLKEQDPLNELNDLANQKRKRTSDLKDHSRSTKKHKSSVQHEREIEKYLHFSLCSGSETEECLCKELQFSLVDNSKLNVSLSSKEITPQLSFNHLAIPQASNENKLVQLETRQGGSLNLPDHKETYDTCKETYDVVKPLLVLSIVTSKISPQDQVFDVIRYAPYDTCRETYDVVKPLLVLSIITSKISPQDQAGNNVDIDTHEEIELDDVLSMAHM
ncbi:hypothetical protein Tco_1338941 [Tanacetum coccineum]